MSVSAILFLMTVLSAPSPLAVSAVFMWDAFAQPTHGRVYVPLAECDVSEGDC